MLSRKSVSTILTMFVFLSTALAARAAEFELTLAYIPVKGTTYVDVTETFAQRVKEATHGRVEIITNDSVVKGTQLAQAVRDGRVQLSTILAGYYSATNPQFGLAQLPGLMNNLGEFEQVFNGFWREDMNRLLDREYKSRALVWGLFCPQNLISISPIRTVADFKGKKIRVNNIETATLVDSFGAKPTPMPASEVLPALQRGIIDGVFTSSCWAYGQAFYAEAKYVTLWPISTILPFPIVINNDTWNRLPKDLQEILTAEGLKLEKESFANYAGVTKDYPSLWAKKGVEYYVVPEAETKRLFKAENIAPVYKSFFERARKAGFDGRAYVKRAEEILGKSLGY